MDLPTLSRTSAPSVPGRVTVLVVATGSRLTGLAGQLPPNWTVLRGTTLESPARDPDVVVLDDPGRRLVTQACLRHPTASIVVVLSPSSDHREVVEVLEAGADACVRSSTIGVVAAHVQACRRRQAQEMDLAFPTTNPESAFTRQND